MFPPKSAEIPTPRPSDVSPGSLVPPKATRIEPFASAVDKAKAGDISAALRLLAIDDPLNLPDIDVHFISLEKALALFGAGSLSEAAPVMERANVLVQKSSSPWVKGGFTVLLSIAEAVRALHAGNAHGAFEILYPLLPIFERLAFRDAEAKKVFLSLNQLVAVSVARALLNSGDVRNFERLCAELKPRQDDLLSMLDDSIQDDLNARAAIHSIGLELATVMCFMNLSKLEFDALDMRLASVQTDVYRLEKLLPRHSAKASRSIGEAEVLQYRSLSIISRSARRVIFARAALNRNDRRLLEQAAADLQRARDLALSAGIAGAGVVWQAETLSAFANNLAIAGRGSGRDFGRYGGILSGGAFAALWTLYNTVAKPQGWVLAFSAGIILVMSLVVGFGVSAVKFWPLVSGFVSALTGSRSNKR